MEVPFLEQVKIQAQILVPILKEFQEEFGEKKVNEVVERATSPIWRHFGDQWWENTPGTPVEKISKAIDMFAIGDAIDVEELKKTESEYDFNITRCSYAEFYRGLGEPELGSLLVCGVDEPMTEGYGADVTLERRCTIMNGAERCEFRYTIRE